MATKEHIFYFAGAFITETYRVGQYKLWLPDFRDEDKKKRWLAGESIPEHECVIANRSYVIDLDDEETAKERTGGHFVISRDIPLTALPRDMCQGTSDARAAISEELWNKIPDKDRPYPPLPDQLYRLKVIVRYTDMPSRMGLVGFHVKVIAVADGMSRIQFMSWTDVLLRDTIVDLNDKMFDPVSNGHSKVSSTSPPDFAGPLFVSLEGIKALGLDIPKVPYGAGGS